MDRNLLVKLRRGRLVSVNRVGIFLIATGVLWGIYLISAAHWTFRDPQKEREYLQKEIIRLSQEYIVALGKEKDGSALGSHSTLQMAVLLQNMLDRIGFLESSLTNVIVNSTNAFAKMAQDINKLNYTISREINKTSDRKTKNFNCEVSTDDPAYPQCADKVAWLNVNWQNDKKYSAAGVNGSICSFLHYLSHVEDHCPKSFLVASEQNNYAPTEPANKECVYVSDPAFPSCASKIEWMQKYWKSDALYASHGVDGSMCSILIFLSEVEAWCPMLRGRSTPSQACRIPTDAGFPHCNEKVAWLKQFWTTDPCYKNNGVNGSVCSFIRYLSEVEAFCPLEPGRARASSSNATTRGRPMKPDVRRSSVEDLVALFHGETASPLKYEWMVSRIKRLWPDWIAGREKLMARLDLGDYSRKKILVYIGLLADETNYHFAEQATKGGPLGELVQWSDLIAALFMLGHDLTISLAKTGHEHAIDRLLVGSIKGSCPSPETGEYDIIYTDYIGLSHIIRAYKNIQSIKCVIRIVDSFGTEAQFNHQMDANLKNIYGFHGLNLKQYNTMFPHSPDNTFLGFTVENHVKPGEKLKKKPIALVYGKHPSMWQDHLKVSFLDVVQKHFEVHATVGDGDEGEKSIKYLLPRYVINHGVMKGADLQNLLKETKVFVGMGFPYEGPAPLEAIANGCFFLNAKLSPPLGRLNNEFFAQKPTLRALTSQHPYAEQFIGLPYVYTIRLDDHAALEAAMLEIKNKEVEPYLPLEFTYEGMLERLYAFTKHHDFCRGDTSWPPVEARRVFLGNLNQACDEVCHNHELLCEPAYFKSINDPAAFALAGLQCSSPKLLLSLVSPGLKEDGECILQQDPVAYSCTARSPSTKRLCPCRDFRPGQVALCRNCLP